MRRVAALLVALTLAPLVVACDSEDGGEAPATAPAEATAATPSATPSITYLNTPTATPAWTRTPEPAPAVEPVGHPAGTETGIARLDEVIAAILSGTIPEDLIQYRSEPCVPESEPYNYGPPPVCPEGAAPGTPVELIPSSGCHGGYATPPDPTSSFRPGSRVPRLLFGVAGPPPHPSDDRALYAVVVSHANSTGAEWGVTYEVGDRGIVAINGGCLWSPDYMWELLAEAEVVLAPPEGAIYGYSRETPVESSDVARQVAQAVALRVPAELRELLSPNEAACFAHIRINTHLTDDCATTPSDPEDPALVVSGCHAGVRTVEEFERALDEALDGRPRLYGVRRIAGWPDARASVVLVFSRPSQRVAPAFAILVSDEGIVGFDGSCGEDVAGLWVKYDPLAVGSPMLPAWEPR